MNYKNIVKNYVVPAGYLKIASKVRNKLIGKKFPNNSILENAEASARRCFILATGPSLAAQDLSMLKGELCISLSNFFVHDLYSVIKPKYHVFAGSHLPITEEKFSAWLADAEAKSGFDVNFVMTDYDYNNANKRGIMSGRQVYSYRYGGDFPVSFVSGIPPIKTVVHIAIYLAMYLGIKKIYLLGVDHDMIHSYGQSRHFYNEKQHKMVERGYNEWFYDDIGHLFDAYATLWGCYRSIKHYADAVGCEIVNLNPDSILDIFPKSNLLTELGS
jgi:hypothetical protein